MNTNTLKILAAIFMLIDHIGVIFFPRVLIFRQIGRLAYPIFAYMIAEGCKYTRNKLKYFGLIFALGIVCQLVYFVVDHSLYMCILITFSCSILEIYLLQTCKSLMKTKPILSIIIILSSLYLLYELNQMFVIDYGFWGMMVPVFVSLGDLFDMNKYGKIGLLAVGLLFLANAYGGIQYLSLLSCIFFIFYNGKKGKLNLKYFFYIFYPLHLVILYALDMFI